MKMIMRMIRTVLNTIIITAFVVIMSRIGRTRLEARVDRK